MTPILKLNNVLLTSLPEDLTDRDALDFQGNVLRTLRESEAKGIIIDITGLSVVDSFMSRVLAETAAMAKLVGAEAVVCGMQPAVALTLVEMGRELVGVETALNLDQGMARLHRLIAEGKTGA